MNIIDRFVYVVVFKCNQTGPSGPIVFNPKGIGNGTVPHLLDPDLVPTLELLRFCLHLPRGPFDLYRIGIEGTVELKKACLPHRIILLPHVAIRHLPKMVGARDVCVTISPKEFFATLKSIAPKYAQLPFGICAEEICESNLNEIWESLHEVTAPYFRDWQRAKSIDTFIDWNSMAFALPTRFQEIQLPLKEDLEIDDPMTGVEFQMHLQALDRLGRSESPPALSTELLETATQEELFRRNHAVSVTCPGVAPSYLKVVQHLATEDEIAKSAESEKKCFSILSAYTAIAEGGVGMVSPEIPTPAFTLLDNLETAFSANRVEPKKIWRILRSISDELDKVFSPADRHFLGTAGQVCAMTNFPISLYLPDSYSSPLCYRTRIEVVPLHPLTRTLQFTQSSRFEGYYLFRKKVRVLVAECIPTTDPVGERSRLAWTTLAKDEKQDYLDVTIKDFNSVHELIEQLKNHRYDMMVLSAHGFYQKEKNLSGVLVGDEPFMGLELDHVQVPPFVVLSACHTNPKGRSAVSIVDVLIRNGAKAVLGTFVPVRVDHNATVVTRLFANILEWPHRRNGLARLSDVWHHTQASNAMNDIILSNKQFTEWAFKKELNGNPVMVEFMMNRSVGRLRDGLVYDDTAKIFLEMAKETGDEERVRSWLSSQSFVPESAMYCMFGRPSHILLDFEDELTKRAKENFANAKKKSRKRN